MPKGIPVTDRQKETIRKCVEDNLELREIIERTGLDQRTVNRWVKKVRGE